MFIVKVFAGDHVVDEAVFFSESAAVEHADRKQDEGYKVRVTNV